MNQNDKFYHAMFSEEPDVTVIKTIVEEVETPEVKNDYSTKFYEEQLAIGARHEAEHTTMTAEEAKQIAADHLKESIFYYVDLQAMEDEIEIRDKVLRFMKNNPDYTHEEFCAFCEGIGTKAYEVQEKFPKWLVLLASVYDFSRKAYEDKAAPVMMSESKPKSQYEEMYFKLFGEMPKV